MSERRAPGCRPVLLLIATLFVSGCGGRPGPAAVASPTPASPPSSILPPPPPGVSFGAPATFAVAGTPPVTGTPWFLTIGDSITAGYTRDPGRQGTNSGWPVQLESLLAGTGRPWRLFDVACSGETAVSYRTACPQRAAIPFLQNSSQHDVAVAAIAAHRDDLRLIIVDLGSNDLILAALAGAPVSSLASALQERLAGILAELRQLAPHVPLVVANYYDPFQNSSPTTLTDLISVNSALASLARRNGAAVADFFSAINTSQGPNPALCAWLDCGHLDPVHPTVAGHARLAAAAAAAAPSR